MIGVIANPEDRAIATEFFELFKTPWEFYDCDRRYEILLHAATRKVPAEGAKLTVVYSPPCFAEGNERLRGPAEKAARFVSHKGKRIPIYGGNLALEGKEPGGSGFERCREATVQTRESSEGTSVCIGYCLFDEIRILLTRGQPAENAGIPTLELHIDLLRDLIVKAGITFVEIPPVPEGNRFIVCLTHDVDHPSIRKHKWDHTVFGFLYRATVGSLVRALRGRLAFRGVLQNWAAAFRLPLVYLGLCKDFWADFDRYVELEKGLGSSFFVIPFRNRPGRSDSPEWRRASRYGAAEIAATMRKLMFAGCELGLHGIDAWHDSSCGLTELEEIRKITGATQIGARMHWLYFDERSPEVLEKAGVDYDSSSGYNETVGYRAGTTQGYKPPQAVHLLELPMHVMDTALFYPGHLDLSFSEAKKRLACIVNNAVELGGCVTVNWHDRSIAPERLWGEFYRDLINTLSDKGAWFATAGEAVSWFRKRRAARFEIIPKSGEVRVRTGSEAGRKLPGLQLRVHNAVQPRKTDTVGAVV